MTDKPQRPPKGKYKKVIGPRLNKLLSVVFCLFALLFVNSVYLITVSMAGWATGEVYENWFYLNMFALHLVLGLMILVPVLVFGIIHISNAYNRWNRRAVKVGYAMFAMTIVLLASGIILTRIEGVIVVKDATVRSVAYWLHVLTPVAVIWLYVIHRLAGKKIKWKIGLRWGGVAAVFAILMLILQTQDPRKWNVEGNPEGAKYFFPSLARTVTGDFIPERVLHNDDYCLRCHQDAHEAWASSAHRYSSFNNPVYLFSVRQTREFLMERDGNIQGSRFCGGCHDPVPFFTGKFNNPDYDDVHDPTARAGITCTSCHSITHVNTNRGNSDFTIEEPIHYPFAFSENSALQWINEQLVKAKPEFHKKTFLKPLHKTAEFCSACHKVHLPEELNAYKFLRGQNHYDSYLLSGVSGHGVSSFYYPPEAEHNCNGCHMPLEDAGEDFAGKVRDDSGVAKIMDHQFPSANTAVPLFGRDFGELTEEQATHAIAAHRKFTEGVMRVDIFGLRRNGQLDGELTAPLRPEVPTLQAGETYLLDTIIRTVKMGHHFTQGTTDSNEIWLDVTVSSGGRIIGRSGGLSDDELALDPWAYHLNVFLLDRNGDRINRRNAQDIFTPLYNHQIPPGAADVVHYKLTLPDTINHAVTVDVKLLYRKFDAEIMAHAHDDPDTPELDSFRNDLPILTLAEDSITFPVEGVSVAVPAQQREIPVWQRWNDYGIALFRKPGQGELRQAEYAFKQVEALGRPDGPINLARVYLREGRVTHEAPDALRRARDFDPPAREWSVLWFSGLVNRQNGQLDDAISSFKQILDGGFEQAVGRGFDFTLDYRLLNQLAGTLFDRSKLERGERRKTQRAAMLREAEKYYLQALAIDMENVNGHYGLKQVYLSLGKKEASEKHAALHARYKPDDNARDLAVAAARIKYPAANHAAEAVVIYDLQRPGAPGLPETD